MDDLRMLQKTAEELLKKDKDLEPIACVYTVYDDVVQIVELGDSFSDPEKKEGFIKAFAESLKIAHAYKVILINEIWLYEKPKTMSDYEADQCIKYDVHREMFKKQEGYTILELTQKNCRAIIRLYDRVNDEIVLGKETETHEPFLDALNILQEALSSVQ